MKDVILTVYGFTQKYLHQLVADLPEEQLVAQPVAGQTLNHAAFLLSHLAWAEDAALGLLGVKPRLGGEWKEMAAMGTTPQADRARYPSKDSLLTTLDEVHARLVTAYGEAAPELLAQPAPERMRARFATIGIAASGLMTSHRSMHLGQLSAWRRALGYPGVF
ncbi:MAG TPA: DinB family protein [Pirellulales bacterium]|nr:DinB family protein [Pirellulales bacterium]